MYILAMSEQDNFGHEDSSMISSPLDRLYHDLYFLGDYGQLYMSFQRYLREELDISEESADELARTKELTELLPDREFYEADPEAANDHFKLAIYHFVAPFYEATHTKEETDTWMNELMGVLLPEDTCHDRETCMENATIGDTWCSNGDCPIRTIAMDVEVMSLQVNFDALAYSVDAERESSNVYRRIEVAKMYQVIDSERAAYLTGQYLASYTRHFPSS